MYTSQQLCGQYRSLALLRVLSQVHLSHAPLNAGPLDLPSVRLPRKWRAALLPDMGHKEAGPDGESVQQRPIYLEVKVTQVYLA